MDGDRNIYPLTALLPATSNIISSLQNGARSQSALDQLRLLLQLPRGVAERELQKEREESNHHSQERQRAGAGRHQ